MSEMYKAKAIFHPIHLATNEMIDQRLRYIHQNPVVEGYGHEPEHFVYSSARDYAGMVGLIPLHLPVGRQDYLLSRLLQ
jgi:hypothetical protein